MYEYIISNISLLVGLIIILLVFYKPKIKRKRKYNQSSHTSKSKYKKVINISSKYFEFKKKEISCRNVYIRMRNRKPAKIWPPPKSPPSYLYNKFTQNGEMPIKEIFYFAQRYSGSTAAQSEWNIELINKMIDNHKQNKQIGGYSVYEENLIDKAITKYSVTGKDVAVIGSESPWVEAIVASKNPKSITTIEYGKIHSTIPYLKTYTPDEFAKKTIKEELKFDFVISHSSMEHSGLGRYGDELDPEGDIHAAEEVWCMLKDGGYFLIGLPYRRKSFIRWNADRNYGPERMKYFAANFEQIEFFGQPWQSQNPLLLKKVTPL